MTALRRPNPQRSLLPTRFTTRHEMSLDSLNSEERGSGALESRSGFGYGLGQAKVRPSYVAIRVLLGNERFTEAVTVWLLTGTNVGGILKND